jgi:hypothetical protein
VLHARAGNEAAAREDAKLVVETADPAREAFAIYQVAGAYSLLSGRDPKHKATALDLLAQAFRLDSALVNHTYVDPELRPLARDGEFQELRGAAIILARPKK